MEIRPHENGCGQFELYAQQLGLTEQSYVDSRELREWCRVNRHRCYIPEWLLKEWRMTVTESDL